MPVKRGRSHLPSRYRSATIRTRRLPINCVHLRRRQSEIPVSVLGDRAPYVTDGMSLFVESFRGVPALVTVPLKVRAR